jgi:hypothetical protein
VRLVRPRHDACGEETLIRVPSELPARAVRRVVCGSCGEDFECGPVAELGVLSPASDSGQQGTDAVVRPNGHAGELAPPLPTPIGALRRARLAGRSLPGYAMAPIALAAVVGGLLLIQSWTDSSSNSPPQTPPAEATAGSPATAPATPAAGAEAATPANEAKLIRGTNFSIALPAGWSETAPQGGATFAAAASDGSADATLWIRNDPKLDYPTFEASSLAQLRALAGSAHVAGRVAAPTPEGTVVRLAADAPADQPAYSVTLRVSGPYRYYLATTLEPNAPATAATGVELLSNSLTPVIPGAAAQSASGG